MVDEKPYKIMIEIFEEAEGFSDNATYDFSESENHQEKPALEELNKITKPEEIKTDLNKEGK